MTYEAEPLGSTTTGEEEVTIAEARELLDRPGARVLVSWAKPEPTRERVLASVELAARQARIRRDEQPAFLARRESDPNGMIEKILARPIRLFSDLGAL